MSVFDDAVFDLNAAGSVSIDPVTRFVSGDVGVTLVDDPFGDPQEKIISEVSPYILASNAVEEVSGQAVDLSAAVKSYTSGSGVMDGDVFVWTRSAASGSVTLTFPLSFSEGDRVFVAVDLEFLIDRMSATLTLFDSVGTPVGSSTSDVHVRDSGARRGFLFTAVATGDVESASLTLSRRLSSNTSYGNASTFYSISASLGPSWIPGLSPGDMLLSPLAGSTPGSVRFEGPGTFGVYTRTNFGDWGFRKSSPSVQAFNAFGDEEGSSFTPLGDVSNAREAESLSDLLTSDSWGFGTLLEGEWVEVASLRNGSAFGWEWEGAENNSRSLANVVRNGVLELGASMGVSTPPGVSFFLDLVPDEGSWDVAWARTGITRKSEGGFSVYGGVDFEVLPKLLVNSSGEGEFQVFSASGSLGDPVNDGPPGFVLHRGTGVRRVAAWDRPLTGAEIAEVLAEPRDISWVAPHDGGSPILGYRVFGVRGGEFVSFLVSADVTSLSVDEFSGPVAVSAVNAVGQGTPGVV